MADDTKFSTIRWAIEMTKFWETASPGPRFPVDVALIADAVSKRRYPKDPIKGIKGGDIPGFEGALFPIGTPTDGWAIIFNEKDVSPGRKQFTIAHEFGHYLAHRQLRPGGIKCDAGAITGRDGKGIEKEADEFAAYLLMPFDDFRTRIGDDDKPTLEDLSGAAERYGVSLIAAALRWIEYTNRRSIFVVSRDGGALWARSSEAAYKSGRFFRTKRETFMLPEESLAARGEYDLKGKASGILPAGVWFSEETEEMSVRSNKYDLTLTLLHLPKSAPSLGLAEPHEPDTFDRFTDGR